MTKPILIFAFTVTTSITCWSQAQGVQVQGYIGSSLFPAEKDSALMTGYKSGFSIGGGISKTIRHAIIFNPNIEFTASSKEHYKFSLLSIHNNLKYYPFLLSKIRPYVMIAGNISFVSIHQEAYQNLFIPDPLYSVSNPTHIPVDQITYREPDIKLQFAPTFGLGAGLGFDVPVQLKFVPFLQYSFMSYFSKNSNLINTGFTNNTKNLSTQSILVGLRYNIYEKIRK
jgi:opacity protein-like surface antigen